MNKLQVSFCSLTALILCAGAALPSSASAAECGQPARPLVSDGTSEVREAYSQWKSAHVTSDGADGNLRVQRSAGDKYDTVSEGIAYGMIFAAYNDDQTTFDKLWAYEQAHLDANGLMNWRIGAAGNTLGYNAATDADEDMALALIEADTRWGGYQKTALKQLDLILEHEVEAGSNILKPGDQWGGSELLNPSYISPAYYKVFAKYTGNDRWNAVTEANDAVLAAIDETTDGEQTGLVPDWSTATGQPTTALSYNYGYDAVRSPIRQALASAWSCDQAATSRLGTFNKFFSSQDVTKIVDGYALDGTANGKWHNASFVGPVAAAAIASDDETYREAAWKELLATNDSQYYSESLRLLSMMVATGELSDPLATDSEQDNTEITPAPEEDPAAPDEESRPTVVPPPINTNLDVWWPSNNVAIRGTQPFKATLNDINVNKYDMYWQVDGGSLYLMSTSYEDYPHKQANVNVDSWDWRGDGPYLLTFVVTDAKGNALSSKSSLLTIDR